MKYKRSECYGASVTEVLDKKAEALGYKNFESYDRRAEDLPIKNMKEIASAIRDYFSTGGRSVYVIADYDVDGVSAGTEAQTVLNAYAMLNAINGASVKVIYPGRISNGYGAKPGLIDQIPEDGALLLTVDNGITAGPAIKKAKERGMTVLVLDHHLGSDDGSLPAADIICDPHVTGAQFNGYCAAGLVYRLGKELLPQTDATRPLMDKLLALAAIATVADVVPVESENRTIIKDGLEVLNRHMRFLYKMEGSPDGVTTGLSILLQTLKCPMEIDEGTIGYTIAPAMNAPGRLRDKGAEMVHKLVSCHVLKNYSGYKKVVEVLTTLASNIKALNDERKKIVNDGTEKMLENIDKETVKKEKIIIYVDESLHEGVVGILAGNSTERFHVPSIVFTQSAKDGNILKGSGRSTDNVHLKGLLDEVKNTIIGYGGHAKAAGLSIKREDLEKFRNSCVEHLRGTPEYEEPVPCVDMEISPEQIFDTADAIAAGAPYGERFEAPVVFIKGFRLSPKKYVYMGDSSQHIKFIGDNGVNAVAFDAAEKFRGMDMPDAVDLIGKLSYNSFQEERRLQIEVLDFAPSEGAVTSSDWIKNDDLSWLNYI